MMLSCFAFLVYFLALLSWPAFLLCFLGLLSCFAFLACFLALLSYHAFLLYFLGMLSCLSTMLLACLLTYITCNLSSQRYECTDGIVDSITDVSDSS